MSHNTIDAARKIKQLVLEIQHLRVDFDTAETDKRKQELKKKILDKYSELEDKRKVLLKSHDAMRQRLSRLISLLEEADTAKPDRRAQLEREIEVLDAQVEKDQAADKHIQDLSVHAEIQKITRFIESGFKRDGISEIIPVRRSPQTRRKVTAKRYSPLKQKKSRAMRAVASLLKKRKNSR